MPAATATAALGAILYIVQIYQIMMHLEGYQAATSACNYAKELLLFSLSYRHTIQISNCSYCLDGEQTPPNQSERNLPTNASRFFMPQDAELPTWQGNKKS
eukprot:1360583-Amphidinium_carterae.2